VDWQNKTTSEKEIYLIIDDLLSEIKNKKINGNEEKKHKLVTEFINLAKFHLSKK
jgi:hypothetical protein